MMRAIVFVAVTLLGLSVAAAPAAAGHGCRVVRPHHAHAPVYQYYWGGYVGAGAHHGYHHYYGHHYYDPYHHGYWYGSGLDIHGRHISLHLGF